MSRNQMPTHDRRKHDENIAEIRSDVSELKTRFDSQDKQIEELDVKVGGLSVAVDKDRALMRDHIAGQDQKFESMMDNIKIISGAVSENTSQMAELTTAVKTIHDETRNPVKIAANAHGFVETMKALSKIAAWLGGGTAALLYLLGELQKRGLL